jgi:non-specific serine/threonine protein kinase
VLLQHPSQEFPAVQLAEMLGGRSAMPAAAAAGSAPDARAAAERRLRELKEDLDEAERFNDLGRIEAARSEMDDLAERLAETLGVGANAAARSADAEQARINVTKVIGLAVKKISAEHGALGHYLATTIATGRFCSYKPDPRAPIVWHF